MADNRFESLVQLFCRFVESRSSDDLIMSDSFDAVSQSYPLLWWCMIGVSIILVLLTRITDVPMIF